MHMKNLGGISQINIGKSNVVAFFDFDGTLYDGVVAADFLKFAIRHRALKLNQMARLPKFLYYYALDKLKLADRYDVNVKIYKRIKGWDSKVVDNASKKFFVKVKKKFFSEIVNIVQRHKRDGHKVVIVTSALKEVVVPVTAWLSVDEIMASEVDTNKGIYTGRINVLPVGKMRIKVISKYCAMNNIDMAKSFAYSDHYSDIPMLKGVGNPVAVNPERRLRRYAKNHRWRIIDV